MTAIHNLVNQANEIKYLADGVRQHIRNPELYNEHEYDFAVSNEFVFNLDEETNENENDKLAKRFLIVKIVLAISIISMIALCLIHKFWLLLIPMAFMAGAFSYWRYSFRKWFEKKTQDSEFDEVFR